MECHFSLCDYPEPYEILHIDITDRVRLVMFYMDRDVVESPFTLADDPMWIHLAISMNLEAGSMDLYYNGVLEQFSIMPGLHYFLPE